MWRGLRERLRRGTEGLLPSGGVGERAIKGGVWMGATNVLDRALKILLLVVLAPLLGPEAIGLVGIALLSITALRRFADVGVRKALVQRAEDDVDPFLNTAFTLLLVRGVVLFALLFAGAPLIAALFGEPEATRLIRGIAFAPLLLGLRNPGMVYFKKDLDFHRQFAYRVTGTFSYALVALGYALLTTSVWALVVGYVADAVVRTGMTYLLHPYRPRPRLDLGQARELVGYGKWITGSSITRFLYSQGDDVVVGWLLTATALGYYQLAYKLATAPAREIADVLANVLFPAYSKLQSDAAALRRAFFETLRLTAFLAVPMAVGIFVVAPSFVRAFLGPAWTPVVTPMRLLVVYGLLQTVASSFAPVWRAVGRPDVPTKLDTARVVVLGVLIVPVTTRWGVEGVAALIAGVLGLLVLPAYVYLMSRTLSASPWRLLRELRYPALAGGAMGALLLATRRALGQVSPLVEFAVLVPLGVVAYAGLTGLFVVAFDWQIKRNLVRMVEVVRG